MHVLRTLDFVCISYARDSSLSTGIDPIFTQGHCSLLYHRLLHYSLEEMGVKERVIMKLALKRLDANLKIRFNCQ